MVENTLLNNHYQFTNPTQIHPSEIPVGFTFKPCVEHIFTYFLPLKIQFGEQLILPPIYDPYTTFFDLYGNLSPPELFTDPNVSDFYCFSALKSHNGSKKRASRVGGGGTWDGDRCEDCFIGGIEVGTNKSFKFKYSKENAEKDDDYTSWILHEYAMDKSFAVEYLNFDASKDFNVNNYVFCHIHKKMDKRKEENYKKRRGNFHLLEDHKKKPCHRFVPKDLGTTTIINFETTTTATTNVATTTITDVGTTTLMDVGTTTSAYEIIPTMDHTISNNMEALHNDQVEAESNVDNDNDDVDEFAEYLLNVISFEVTKDDNYGQGGEMVTETIDDPNIVSNNANYVDGEMMMPNCDNNGDGEYLTSTNNCCSNNNVELESILGSIEYDGDCENVLLG